MAIQILRVCLIQSLIGYLAHDGSLYTVAEDTLDPDDLIFPRAATRVGPKYQVTVPPFGESAPPATSTSAISATSNSNLPPDEVRGTDWTIEDLSAVSRWERESSK